MRREGARLRRRERPAGEKLLQFSWRDTLLTLLALALAIGLSALCRYFDPEGDSYAPMLFLFAVALVSRLTRGYFYGVAAAVLSVFAINFAFTVPLMSFNFSLAGYPLTFLVLLATALLISAMTTQLKRQEERNYRARLEEMRANLLRAVSHDLRTPLTSISAAASLLSDETKDIAPERRRAMLAEISDDAQWLIRMVENLLSITRVGEAADVRKTPEAAEEVVSEAVRKYRARFARPVASNLLENAAFHAEGAENVRVTLRVEGDEAVFEVSDDGAGIPEAKLKTLFDPSAAQPSDSAAHSRNNMGIGLSVCRTIVMAHGGTLSARNLKSGGACFRFTLPMKEEETHA